MVSYKILPRGSVDRLDGCNPFHLQGDEVLLGEEKFSMRRNIVLLEYYVSQASTYIVNKLRSDLCIS